MRWVDTAGTVVNDLDSYTDSEGTTYLSGFPKSNISGLKQVIETPEPSTDPTGYTVTGEARGGVMSPVSSIDLKTGKVIWTTQARPEMTEAEQSAVDAMKMKVTAITAMKAADTTVLRCYEAGVAVPTAWQTYRTTLRDIIYGRNAGPLPVMPSYPAGT